jgi:hypothetical protein
MTSHRTIFSTLTLLAVFMTATTSAAASPLLGGYGGPGEGNQAILGSSLVGGAGGSGGSSGGSSGSNGAAGSTGSSPSAAGGGGASAGVSEASSTGPSGRGSTSSEGGGHAAGRASGSRSGSAETSGGAARTYPPPVSRDDVSQSAPTGSQALGLSAADLGYALLVLGVLIAAGAVTRRLARTPTGPEGL